MDGSAVALFKLSEQLHQLIFRIAGRRIQRVKKACQLTKIGDADTGASSRAVEAQARAGEPRFSILGMDTDFGEPSPVLLPRACE